MGWMLPQIDAIINTMFHFFFLSPNLISKHFSYNLRYYTNFYGLKFDTTDFEAFKDCPKTHSP